MVGGLGTDRLAGVVVEEEQHHSWKAAEHDLS